MGRKLEAKAVVALALMLGWASSARGQEGAQPHPLFGAPPAVDRLANGLTLVTVPWSTPGIVSYFTLVRVGSRDEVEPGRSGFAHLFEHMMFRGTESLPGDAYQRALQAFGADDNAYTTGDFTLYTITASAAALPRLVEIEADRFRNLSYDEEGFRTETGAILGEYNTGAANPWDALWERLSEMAFTRHTYGHTTMGYLRDICAMPEMLDYSRDFFRRYYTPDNTTIIAVGDVRREEILPLVERHYGAWEGQRYDNQVPAEPEPAGGARADIRWPGTTQPQMLIAFRVGAFEGGSDEASRDASRRRTAAREVVRALAFHESSPLYQTLVVEEQLVSEISSWPHDFNRDPGIFTVSVTLNPSALAEPATPASFDPVIERIQAELARIGSGAIPAERVGEVQSHIRYAFIGGLETPGDVANTLGSFIAIGGDVAALERYVASLATVTPEDVAAAARELTPERRFVATASAAAEGEAVAPRPTCADLTPAVPGDAP